MKTVDDYIKEAWQALLKGDTARRDELCAQAERLIHLQRSGGADAWIRAQMENEIRMRPPAVICLPDRSGETIQ